MPADRHTTAADPQVAPDPPAITARSGPVRTCVGCRNTAPATELLRIVVAPDASGGPSRPEVPVVPDPRRRLPGRGAWVHPTIACLERAARRRAFARALRVPGTIDPAAVAEYVRGRGPAATARPERHDRQHQHDQHRHDQHQQHKTDPDQRNTPQEMTSNGNSMKRQR